MTGGIYLTMQAMARASLACLAVCLITRRKRSVAVAMATAEGSSVVAAFLLSTFWTHDSRPEGSAPVPRRLIASVNMESKARRVSV